MSHFLTDEIRYTSTLDISILTAQYCIIVILINENTKKKEINFLKDEIYIKHNYNYFDSNRTIAEHFQIEAA